jgi:23S rRNA (uracil1939-C5)-methyltransferase
VIRPRRSPAPSQELEVEIERVVPGGAGLGRVEGRVALVSGALPGDRVRARLSAAGAGLLLGEVVEVVEAGPARRPPSLVCPRALDGTCGGCDWPAVRPESARELKTALVLDALRRLGKLTPDELPEIRFVASAPGYRLRNRLHLAGGRLGFFAPKSHDVADLLECELVSPELLARLPDLRAAFDEERGLAAEVVTLESRSGEELILEVHAEKPYRDADALARRLGDRTSGVRLVAPDGSVAAQLGASTLVFDAGGASFRVSLGSFFQGNRHLLDAFLNEMRAAVAQVLLPVMRVSAISTALDLYAGVGFLTRPLLEAGRRATAVEVDPSAAADLAFNLARWRREGLPDARAVASSAEDALDELVSTRADAPGLVVADPPRAGLSPRVRRALLSLRPRALVLVSCDPATLARDLAELKAAYAIRRLTLLDLFPSTHHVEAVALLVERE